MKKIEIPEAWPVDEWHGFRRHHFTVDGFHAWIVEPKSTPADDGRWSWCTVWPDAFVDRVGIELLLSNGYHHGHIDAFSTRANPKGIEAMGHFQDMMVSMGLAPKANLIGMSWGGYFSLRYAEENPQRIAAIYLDAPVCNAADPHPSAAERVAEIAACYGLTVEQLKTSPLNPLNRLEVLVNAKIPMLCATGETDQSVDVNTNINLVEARMKELGYILPIVRRPYWGHHPHGFDDPAPLLKFHNDAH